MDTATLWTTHKRLSGGPPSQIPAHFAADCVVATPVAVYRGLREVEGLYASLRERYFDIIENKVTWTCVAGDSVVEEGVMRVSHGGKIEWLLPGVKATEREIVVPTITRATFRNGKLVHKSIWWDTASLMRQTGLLPSSIRVAGKEVTLFVQPATNLVEALENMRGTEQQTPEQAVQVIEDIHPVPVPVQHVASPRKIVEMPMETVNVQVQLTPHMSRMAVEEEEEDVVPMGLAKARAFTASTTTLHDSISRTTSITNIDKPVAMYQDNRPAHLRPSEDLPFHTAPSVIGAKPSSRVLRPPGGGSSISFG